VNPPASLCEALRAGFVHLVANIFNFFQLKFTGLNALLSPLTDKFGKDKSCLLKPLPFSAAALTALEMKRQFNKPVVLITETATLMDEMRGNLEAFAGNDEKFLLDFPPLEYFTEARQDEATAIIEGERQRTLIHLCHPAETFLLNACIQALLQKTMQPAALKAMSLNLPTAQEYEPEKLLSWLEKAGYDFVNEVQERAQAVRRGGLIDVWPPSEEYPLRLEFYGSKLESIRNFDPLDQRSFAKREGVFLTPTSEATCLNSQFPISNFQFRNNSLAMYLPPETIFFWVEKCLLPSGNTGRQYSGFAYHANIFEQAAEDNGRKAEIIPFRQLLTAISEKRHFFSVLEPLVKTEAPLIDPGFDSPSHHPDTPILAYSDTSIRQQRMAMLETKARQGMKVHLFFRTQGALDRFKSAGKENFLALNLGAVSDGFFHEGLNLAVIPEDYLFQTDFSAGQQKLSRRKHGFKAGKLKFHTAWPAAGSITDWTNIEPGDLVVHANHGIGKYLGLYEIVFNGRLQETLAIEYANRARLYVPLPQANLISRYFTAGARKSKIHRLGGSQWNREKQAAQKAVYQLASSLLATEALRQTLAGFAYPPDADWQHDFEAAFPYDETEDQETAIQEIKADMESPVPMDRLVCGDAGYGKTEVAMRAAFKAVTAGKQVAVLVPTTVLALQHYEVFKQRIADYPMRVELLCRLRPRTEQEQTVKDLRVGTVDIVIGTHRLLQSDLAFKELGLIIIDEEQRFGVLHKEHLKHMKNLVDVLTLTATPIPRTLYLSLTGARKISMIQTPPKDRLPVETIIAKNDDQLVREAILREINRGGQVFYLHNRVATIDKINERLKAAVPEAKTGIAHGQMPPRELAETMHAFSRGTFDILLCTTIVESGVDLPNVNTILVDRADRFGIADLYQLRGRVGRSDRRAYAYLLTPGHGHLLDISRRRLAALMEHSKLGSGFKLAMLDLEIRGAGNLLGAEQSGHIAAIGFDLYCQLLQRAIEALKTHPGFPGYAKALRRGEQPPLRRRGTQTDSLPAEEDVGKLAQTYRTAVDLNLDFIDLSTKSSTIDSAAFLPVDYLEDEESRIKIYRKIAAAENIGQIESLRAEFKDRFGPLPKPFERFLRMAVIRLIAAEKCITFIETKGGKILFRRGKEYIAIKNRIPRLRATNADGKLEEIIEWIKRVKI
jgi:transcription-repair coupling factor (superfamily II helicase)